MSQMQMSPQMQVLQQQYGQALTPPQMPGMDPQKLAKFAATQGYADALSRGLGGGGVSNQLPNIMSIAGVTRDNMIEDWKIQLASKKAALENQFGIEESALKRATEELRQGEIKQSTKTEEFRTKGEKADAASKTRKNRIGSFVDLPMALGQLSEQSLRNQYLGEQGKTEVLRGKSLGQSIEQEGELHPLRKRKIDAEASIEENKLMLDLAKTNLISNLSEHDDPVSQRIVQRAILGFELEGSNLTDQEKVIKSDTTLSAMAATPNLLKDEQMSKEFFNRLMLLQDKEYTPDLKLFIPEIVDMQNDLFNNLSLSNGVRQFDGSLKEQDGRPPLNKDGQKLLEEHIINIFSEPTVYEIVKNVPSGNSKALDKFLGYVEKMNLPDLAGKRSKSVLLSETTIPSYLRSKINEAYLKKVKPKAVEQTEEAQKASDASERLRNRRGMLGGY